MCSPNTALRCSFDAPESSFLATRVLLPPPPLLALLDCLGAACSSMSVLLCRSYFPGGLFLSLLIFALVGLVALRRSITLQTLRRHKFVFALRQRQFSHLPFSKAILPCLSLCCSHLPGKGAREEGSSMCTEAPRNVQHVGPLAALTLEFSIVEGDERVREHRPVFTSRPTH